MQTEQQKVFNYRLSRARRIIENCFGILCAKWRIFRAPIVSNLALVEDIVQCCVCLHNWLRKKSSNYITPDLISREVGGTVVPGISFNSLIQYLKQYIYNTIILLIKVLGII